MNSVKPLVSICIPTYNRSKYLKQTIESLVVQDEFISGRVEIVISDNASTDNTEEVVKIFTEKYTNIKYYKNVDNIKDENFPIVLDRASGVLRKLNNDTFKHSKGSLKIICDIVDKYKDQKPVLYFSNKNKISNDIIVDFMTFMKDASFWITWIGSFSIWEDDCENLSNDTTGCDLRLWQVKKVLELLKKKNKAVIVNKKLGKSMPVEKKDISYGLYQVFYTNYLDLIYPYVDGCTLDENTFEFLKRDLLYNFFKDWIINWELSNTDMQYSETENLKELVFNEYKDKPYWNKFIKIYNFKIFEKKFKKSIKTIIGKK